MGNKPSVNSSIKARKRYAERVEEWCKLRNQGFTRGAAQAVTGFKERYVQDLEHEYKDRMLLALEVRTNRGHATELQLADADYIDALLAEDPRGFPSIENGVYVWGVQ